MLAESKLIFCKQIRGRALFIDKAGSLYISDCYAIYRSDDNGQTWVLDCQIPSKGWKPFASQFTLAARFLRYNIQALQVLQDGSRVAVARDGIYHADADDAEMRRTWAVPRGSRPINISGDGNRVLFGEYGPELDTVQVRIYISEDAGRHFDLAYEFPKGDVHHIHNVMVDPYADHYWVFAGDHGKQPGIGILSKDCRHYEWVERGSQMIRAVSALVRPDCLIYGTDSELEPNYIVRLEKKTGRYEKLVPIEGSSLYASDFGHIGIISTCVEPSHVNRNRECSLYGSMNDSGWIRLVTHRKDLWNAILFQFGLIVLPYVQCQNPLFGAFSGQALVRYHNQVDIFQI